MATKKVGTSGRFGPRYGGVMRKAVATIEKTQKAAHACSRCGSMSVYRDGTAIWACVKCGYTFAGGAYSPSTGAGQGAAQALRAVQEKLSNPANAAPDKTSEE
ncbi:MAG TPA: 50S ribosomal protein L37ae [Candidatus Thermoplasmatota archaeon]|nr:50S ribosomal protein L37ae [Candidatus Thermoplasmatota archaeon]